MEEGRIKYWMTKDNWSTLVVIIHIKRLSELLPKIRDLIQDSGLVESYHFRVDTSSLSDDDGISLCYRMLRKEGCTNNQIKSIIGEIISKMISNKDFSFNPEEGNPLKTSEAWLDPYESAKIYAMSHREWVIFIELLNKFSDITASLANEGFLSFHYRSNVVHLFHNILMMNLKF
jgi:hypothetical protein